MHWSWFFIQRDFHPQDRRRLSWRPGHDYPTHLTGIINEKEIYMSTAKIIDPPIGHIN